MSDQKKGLPVRTEEDGLDGRLHSKIVDHTTPAQGMTVDTDGNAHAEMHGNDPAGGDEVLRLSELGAPNGDGEYDAADNTKPASAGLVGHTRGATPADTDQVKRLTAITNGTVHALDMSLHDEDGAAFSAANPLPVVMVESEGTEVNDPNQSTDTAVDGTANHDYTVTALKTLMLTQILVGASVRAKFDISVETAVASGIFTRKATLFTTVSNPNAVWELKEPIAVAAGVKVRVAKKNTDNQVQDLYSTISGHEV